MEECLPMKSRLALAPIIARPCQLMRQDGQGFPLAMCFLYVGQIAVPGCVVAQEPGRRCGKGPRERGVPDFFAGRAQACACGFLGTLAQATLGDNILHAGEALALVNFVEQHEAENLAEPGHGWY
jgi:hypothetical protein